MKLWLLGTAAVSTALILGTREPAAVPSRQNSFSVNITVDAAKPIGDMNPAWRFFGGDEPNYATMHDGKKLMNELGKLGPQQVFFRTHNLLVTGDGTPALKWGSTNAYTEDAQGRPHYDWKILDGIFDTYLRAGVRPYVEIGFMPKALSTHPEPYQHHWTPASRYEEIYTGWTYPPTDYSKWATLVQKWVEHCVSRYGKGEVNKWYWEVWNEPNIGYWQGTPEEFRKLHDYAVDAVRRALPSAKVGGPDMAGSDPRYLRPFLDHCLTGQNYATGQTGTPIDFVSFHAKGSPSFVDGHVRMGISTQLRGIDSGFATVASYPQLKNAPIVVGESDPDGCAACQGPQLAYRNGTMYASYTAESVIRELEIADKRQVNFLGALTWAFEFEGKGFFPGFRVMAANGLDLPVLNVFRMLGKMSGKRLAIENSGELPLATVLRSGVRADADVSALACLEGRKMTVLVCHYHDDDVAGPDAEVDLRLVGLPKDGRAKVTRYQIDQDLSNGFTAWKKMGSPEHPTTEQFTQLEKIGHLTAMQHQPDLSISAGTSNLHFELQRQAVSLFEIQW